MSNVQHLHNRRYASLACNSCRESKIKVPSTLPQHCRKDVQGADDFSVTVKSQVVRIATKRIDNAFIVLSTRESEYIPVHVQC
jgi:hypothetical protein